jgi:hypothetical protein
MPAAPHRGIEPQAPFLRLLAAKQPAEVVVDLANQFVR